MKLALLAIMVQLVGAWMSTLPAPSARPMTGVTTTSLFDGKANGRWH